MKRNKRYIFGILLIAAIVANGCRNTEYIEEVIAEEEDSTEVEDLNDNDEYDSTQVDTTAYPDWTEYSHGNSTSPVFDLVFSDNDVKRLDITISAANWKAMWDDLDDNLGSSNNRFPNGGGGGGDIEVDFTPIWVPCTFSYNGIDWYEVGVRYKGNSSLSTGYSSGNEKLSMKIDFDEYEDDYPALKNQRFYGFKQLNLNCNYEDKSLMREKVVGDLFRDFGVPAAHTSYCVVYIDYGSGPEYFGVYTIVEEVDDTVIDTQFSDGSGNLYKPEEDASKFAYGSYNGGEFNLKTNKDVANYSDVRALYDVLHQSNRTSNNTQWQADLEAVLDVDGFLKWLAANIVIQNWDTYGNMGHNYFLYNNPSTGLLTWIPWDNNEALQTGQTALSHTLTNISSSWPLLSYLMAVDSYKNTYKAYMQQFIDEVFTVSRMTGIYESYYSLLQQYAVAEKSGRTYVYSSSYFTSAVNTLKTHVQSRYTTITNYLK